MSSRRIDQPKYDHLVTKQKAKSAVWTYFGLPADNSGRIINKNIALCRTCDISVSCKNGNTSNMTSHLKVYHPLLFHDLSVTTLGTSAVHKHVHAQSAESLVEAVMSDSTPSNSVIKKVVPHEEQVKQETDFDFQQLNAASSSKECTDSVTKFIAGTLQPYRIVEHPLFVNMLKTLNPHYNLPSRKFFAKSGIPKLYNIAVERMENELLVVDEKEVSVTVDCWSSISETLYVALIAHFISDDWNIQSFCLCCKNFELDHAAADIKEMFRNTLSEWGINLKNIVSCTTDNRSNILKTVYELGIPHILCFGHNINIGINNAMEIPQLKVVIKKLKKIENLFSQNWEMKRDLGIAQEALQMEITSLPSACPVSWWSTLKLCKKFLKNQRLIAKVLLHYPSKKHLMLDGTEISVLEDLVSATDLLEDMRRTICGEEYMTASSILPLCQRIKKRLLKKDEDSILKKKIKTEILTVLRQKYEEEPMVSMLEKCSLCDPRFRFYFSENTEKAKVSVMQEMCDIYLNMQDTNEESGSDSHSELPIKKIKKGLSKIFSSDDEDENFDDSSLTPYKKMEIELEKYLSMPKVNLEKNPLVWWKAHQEFFPILKKVALKYLTVQGSSVPSEMIFNTGQNIIAKHRVSLVPKNAEMQFFLARNRNFM